MTKKIGKTFIIVLLITIATQILNMLRSIYLSNDFGASQILDAFYLSNIFTVTIFNVIGISITTILIPEFSSPLELSDKKKAIEEYMTVLFLLVLVFVSMLFFFLFFGISFVSPNFSEKNQSIFLCLTFILSIGQFFRIQTAFSTAIIQSRDFFIIPKFATLLSALLPIAYILMAKKIDIIFLTIYIVLGYVLEATIVLLVQSKDKKYRFKPRFSRLNNQAKKLLLNTFPIIISSAVFQLQLIISNYVIGFFGDGYITILSNTNQIVGIFQLLFVANIITMAYPKIAREVKKNAKMALQKLDDYITYTNSLIILLAWGYLSLGQELINLMFLRGNFTVQDAKLVFYFGIFLVFSLPISVIRDYYYRFLYSVNNVKAPTNNAIQTVFINIILILVLKNFIGPYSVTVATLIGTVVSTIGIIIKTKNLGYTLNVKKLLLSMLFFNVFGLIMWIIIRNIHLNINSLILSFSIRALIGATIYVILTIIYYKLFLAKKGK